MTVNTVNLFISHSWKYADHYDGLTALLEKAPYFKYKNYSVPKDDPIHNVGTDRELTEAIHNQMLPTSAVLILAGVYASYSKWINIEIRLARMMLKPIIAVVPWGAEKISTPVKQAADMIVHWNTDSVVNAIREVCRA